MQLNANNADQQTLVGRDPLRMIRLTLYWVGDSHQLGLVGAAVDQTWKYQPIKRARERESFDKNENIMREGTGKSKMR